MNHSYRSKHSGFTEMAPPVLSDINSNSFIRRFKNLINLKFFKKVCNVFYDHMFSDNPTAYNHPVEKAIRSIVYLVAILGTFTLILEVTMDFDNTPTVTSVETARYPVQNINFPGIAICSVNRIGRTAATHFAEELMQHPTVKNNTNLTVTDLVDMIKVLGYLYLSEVNDEDAEKVDLLHKILEEAYNGYDIGRIMKDLAPKCRYVLSRCGWKRKEQVCTDLFFRRRTEHGYCCTFNYVRSSDEFGRLESSIFTTNQIERPSEISAEYGLSVLLNPQFDDPLYSILPSPGFKIFIYLSLDFPDTTSGGLREVLIPPRTENYVDLDAVTYYSVPGVMEFDVHKRDCLFSSENDKIFHGQYSYSDCLVYCRSNDMFKICNCIPFFYPIPDNIASARVCNLKDLKCLNKYKDRWLTFMPRSEDFMQTYDEEKLGGKAGHLNCDCLPSCEDVRYTITSSSVPITQPELFWGRSKFFVKNQSVVHIFFGKAGTVRLRQDVLFYWYELMSTYGGICNLFLGVSIINFIEILYNAVLTRLKNHQFKTQEVDRKSEDKTKIQVVNGNSRPTDELTILYWNEMARSVKQREYNISDLRMQQSKF